jgi:RHS repeat-associated protein
VRAHTGAEAGWTYTGEQNDPNGLVYLRARYYDPAVGRFLSSDPWMGMVRYPQSLNRYVYVLNNPCNLVDPWGLQAAEGAVVVVCSASGAGCVVVVVGAGVAACWASPACREWAAGTGEALWGGLEALGGGLVGAAEGVGGFIGGLFGKKGQEKSTSIIRQGRSSRRGRQSYRIPAVPEASSFPHVGSYLSRTRRCAGPW